MPVGNKYVDQALYILKSHAVFSGDRVINTHRLDNAGDLGKKHHCFNGLLVSDVLMLDKQTTLVLNEESKAILGAMLHHIDWSRNPHSPQQYAGFVLDDDVQNAVEVALFLLEKSSIKEAHPEISKHAKEN